MYNLREYFGKHCNEIIQQTDELAEDLDQFNLRFEKLVEQLLKLTGGVRGEAMESLYSEIRRRQQECRDTEKCLRELSGLLEETKRAIEAEENRHLKDMI